MHFSKFILCATLATVASAFDPITLTVGGTAVALTGTQVAFGVAGLAGLAIVKEKLLFAGLSRRASRRGRRAADELSNEIDFELAPFFHAIALTDVSDCGKMLVCNIAAKSQRTAQEQLVADLFPAGEKIDLDAGHAAFQLAARRGAEFGPNVCFQTYAACPVGADQLSEILETHAGNQPQVQF